MPKKISICIFTLFILSGLLIVPQAGHSDAAEKIGVVFLGFGMEEEYKIDWIVGYQDHLYPIFHPGMLAGGHLEGDTCYTLIHYANEIEAEICSEVTGNTINVGTPIDTFCNEYTNTAEYPVHSMLEHSLLGTDGYLNCCSPHLLSFFMSLGHTTTDPNTGEEIIGPHVDDPDGTGIGIADFHELFGFLHMEYHYALEDHKSPYRKQLLRWIYGNDLPAHYGYAPDETELTNVKDELEKALEDTGIETVVRIAWITYIENMDIYGNELFIPDSVESVLTELIEEEQVDRIILMGSSGHFTNITAWGYCWKQADATGISRIEDKTYYECINDLEDGYGPDTLENLETLLTDKPWRKYASPNPLAFKLSQNISPDVPVAFTRAFGDYEKFNDACLEQLMYTIEKYHIDSTAKLKVILAVHGYAGGYLEGAECDAYFVQAEKLGTSVAEKIQAYLADTWESDFETVFAPNEFAQPSFEGISDDTPTWEAPRGMIIGVGEHIDMAINGKYVDELGRLVDNGNSNFDYIIVLPIGWDAENVDTIQHFRHETLGNHALQEAQGMTLWLRQGESEDGDEYTAQDDFDSEYYTVKVMDGSGWKSTPAYLDFFDWLPSFWSFDPQVSGGHPFCLSPVDKGSPENPTTVILAGCFLSLPDGAVRKNLTDAAVACILDTIDNPLAGGYHDMECEIKALNDIFGFSATAGCSAVTLSWSTMSEIESQGFDLFRATAETGTYEKITDTPVVPEGNEKTGSSYTYTDTTVNNGRVYYYKIEHVYAQGSALYGPVTALPLLINIFDPL